MTGVDTSRVGKDDNDDDKGGDCFAVSIDDDGDDDDEDEEDDDSSMNIDDDKGEVWFFTIIVDDDDDDDDICTVDTLLELPPISTSSRKGDSSRKLFTIVDLLNSMIRDVSLWGALSAAT